MFSPEDLEKITKLAEDFKLDDKYNVILILSPVGEIGTIGQALVLSNLETHVIKQQLLTVLHNIKNSVKSLNLIN